MNIFIYIILLGLGRRWLEVVFDDSWLRLVGWISPFWWYFMFELGREFCDDSSTLCRERTVGEILEFVDSIL